MSYYVQAQHGGYGPMPVAQPQPRFAGQPQYVAVQPVVQQAAPQHFAAAAAHPARPAAHDAVAAAKVKCYLDSVEDETDLRRLFVTLYDHFPTASIAQELTALLRDASAKQAAHESNVLRGME
jgi:hypothetical protein